MLAPSISTTGTATTTVTEADLPGPITNTATVTGTYLSVNTVTTTTTESVAITYTNQITVEKIATPSSGPPARIGDTITYTYRITNTGIVTLYTVSLNDDKLGSVPITGVPLGPDQSTSAFTTTVVIESDLPGPLTNTVTVTGTNILAENAIATDTASVPLTYTAAITVDKTASQAIAIPGDTITYTYRITNTGDITLTGIIIYDDQPDATFPPISTTLGPKQSTTGTYFKNITQADLPGPITNTATVTGTNAIVSQTAVATDTATVVLTYTTAISLEKTVNVSSATLDDVITYTYQITNSGNVSLTNITLIDDKLGPISLPTTFLLPGFPTSQSISYTVSQSDFPGPLTNTATVTGTNFAAAEVSDTDMATVTLAYTPSIQLVKTADVLTAAPGQTITYTYLITNTGNVTLTGIVLNDDKLGSITLGATSLTPKLGTTGTATYTVLAGDIPAITNTATVTGDDILSQPVTDTKTLIVGVEAIITAITATNSSPNIVNSPTFFTVTTSITNGVIYTWNFDDGSPTATGQTVIHTYTTVGTYTAVVTATNGVSTISTTTVVTITPGPIDHFALSATVPQTAGLSFPITIRAEDVYGNLVDTFNQAITITDTTGTIVPTSVTLINGITVTNFTVYSATSPALDIIEAISGTITGTIGIEIRPNVPHTFTVVVNPTTLHLCETAIFTGTLTDEWNNPTPNRTILVQQFAGPPPVGWVTPSPPSGPTDTTGTFTSTLQATTAGQTNVYGWEIDLPKSSNNTVAVSVITPAIPSAITTTVIPSTVVTGGTAIVSATVDSCAGLADGVVVTFTIPGAFGSVNPITATTVGGVATTTVTAGSTPGSTFITGTVEGPISDATPFTIIPPASPVLTIAKTATPAGGNVGQSSTIVYQIVVSNSGTATATNVVITDALDSADVGFTGAGSIVPSGNGPVDTGGEVITFTVASLGPGASVTATIEVTVTASVSGTIITNTAIANSTETGVVGPTAPIVTHQVITQAVGPVYLPIIIKGGPASLDLTVRNVVVSNLTPNTGDLVTIDVTLHNTGTAFATPFWVDLYLSTAPINPAVNQTWEDVDGDGDPNNDDNLVPYGVAWKVGGMPADNNISITNLVPNDLTAANCNNYSNFIPAVPGCWETWKGIPLNNYFRNPGTYYLYVRVDSFDEPGGTSPNGEILESDETNNLYNNGTPIIITVGGGAPLPSVSPLTTPDLETLDSRGRPSVQP
jgi:uncharacterized repeat protein (TIGR01451 family)